MFKLMVIGVGDKFLYKDKNGNKKTGIVECFAWHSNFCEIYFTNGDTICDSQIIKEL